MLAESSSRDSSDSTPGRRCDRNALCENPLFARIKFNLPILHELTNRSKGLIIVDRAFLLSAYRQERSESERTSRLANLPAFLDGLPCRFLKTFDSLRKLTNCGDCAVSEG